MGLGSGVAANCGGGNSYDWGDSFPGKEICICRGAAKKREKKKKDPSLDISLYDHFAYIYLNIKMQV